MFGDLIGDPDRDLLILKCAAAELDRQEAAGNVDADMLASFERFKHRYVTMAEVWSKMGPFLGKGESDGPTGD